MTYWRPDGGMGAMGAPDNRMVALLALGLFGLPRDELAGTVDGAVPEWIDRLYDSYGTSADSAPASVSVLPPGESRAYRLRTLSGLLAQRHGGGSDANPRLSDLL